MTATRRREYGEAQPSPVPTVPQYYRKRKCRPPALDLTSVTAASPSKVLRSTSASKGALTSPIQAEKVTLRPGPFGRQFMRMRAFLKYSSNLRVQCEHIHFEHWISSLCRCSPRVGVPERCRRAVHAQESLPARLPLPREPGGGGRTAGAGPAFARLPPAP